MATISIHALRVEGDTPLFRHSFGNSRISIHALRVEGDCKLAAFLNKMLEISIHALRVEGDNGQFLCVDVRLNFYPRPPGGGRQFQLLPSMVVIGRISIHALRVEGDY